MLKILIVDDNAVYVEMLHRYLKIIPGLWVCGVEDTARGALEAISVVQPDVVSLDIWLKEGSGTDVLRGIQDVQNPPQAIMLSSEDPDLFLEECITLGADCYFHKSSQLNEFTSTIKQMALAHPQTGISGEAP